MGRSGVVVRLLASGAVDRATASISSGRLRVLAYHAVPSQEAFAAHLAVLARRFRPVSGDDVVRAVSGCGRLPERAVWITFDDGDPSVLANGLPLLLERHLPATMFVCPGMIDTTQPYWWTIAEEAVRIGLLAPSAGPRLLRELKLMPDADRRVRISDLERSLSELRGEALRHPQLTTADLQAWCRAGLEVGNHTWDHPLLDRCPPDEQQDQIQKAHDRLRALTGIEPSLFAYPNGNWAAAAEKTLTELGYQIALGFDHRLARLDRPPLRLSRLRVDADVPTDRLKAITSGAHPALLRARQRVIAPQATRTDPRNLPR